MKYLITVYDEDKNHIIEELEENNWKMALQTSLLFSLIHEVEMIDNYTGELHFSKKGIKQYLSTDARMAIINHLK